MLDRSGSLSGQLPVPGDGFEAIVALLSGGERFSSQSTVDKDTGEPLKAHVELDNETSREKPVVEKEEGAENVYLWARHTGPAELIICVDRFPESLGFQLDW